MVSSMETCIGVLSYRVRTGTVLTFWTVEVWGDPKPPSLV